MNIKIHKTKFSTTVALCDSNLIGKILKDKNPEIKLSERFYKGEDLSEEKVIAILKGANSTNIVGEKSIRIALKAGVIDKENIRKIKGVPFAISIAL
ncbi:MAG: DUF424 family protein [Candidatus Woesearchaeota archaeon]|nr:MAG: DUF424 family protein [Candidatus Woesearchaeota archaeon]